MVVSRRALLSTRPFAGGATTAAPGDIKVDGNENPLGPGPTAMDVMGLA